MGYEEILFFALFLAVVLGLLSIDLGVFSRHSHKVSFREAGIWSGVWVSTALAFFGLLYFKGHLVHGVSTMADIQRVIEAYAEHVTVVPGNLEATIANYRHNMATEFITGYLIEYSLSVDNIFVMMLIFKSFQVPEQYYKKVLFWGILGAIVMRFIFIFAGATLIREFQWVLYIFGAFLVYSGVKMFFEDEDEEIDTDNHPVVRFANKYFRCHPDFVGDRFFIRKAGRLFATPLLLVVMVIEFSDVIFAVDSVPAIFAVTKDPYVVFFSNIFAILGLRSMFFFLSNILPKFHLLNYGLAVLLVFIGLKMLLHQWLEAIGFQTVYSLYIILAILGLSIGLSFVFPKKEEQQD